MLKRLYVITAKFLHPQLMGVSLLKYFLGLMLEHAPGISIVMHCKTAGCVVLQAEVYFQSPALRYPSIGSARHDMVLLEIAAGGVISIEQDTEITGPVPLIMHDALSHSAPSSFLSAEAGVTALSLLPG